MAIYFGAPDYVEGLSLALVVSGLVVVQSVRVLQPGRHGQFDAALCLYYYGSGSTTFLGVNEDTALNRAFLMGLALLSMPKMTF